jgi:hypothetical protein
LNDSERSLTHFVDGGWQHGFGMAGAWLCWKPWGTPDDQYGCGRSDYEAMKGIPENRRMNPCLPPAVDKPLPPEGILVYLTPTQGGYDQPIWRYFPDYHDDRPANDEDLSILTARREAGA